MRSGKREVDDSSPELEVLPCRHVFLLCFCIGFALHSWFTSPQSSNLDPIRIHVRTLGPTTPEAQSPQTRSPGQVVFEANGATSSFRVQVYVNESAAPVSTGHHTPGDSAPSLMLALGSGSMSLGFIRHSECLIADVKYGWVFIMLRGACI